MLFRSHSPELPNAALLDVVLRDLLGVDRLDPAASLYDLGADSLTMLDLIDEIKRQWRIELDLSTFSHQVSLAEILDRARLAMVGGAPSPEDVVVEVWQHGTGDNVLCLIHPVGGDIQAYRALVAALGPRLTVCLIADPALRDPEHSNWSLPERAQRYHAALCARSPGQDSRLLLAGWSFGAWVSVAMAACAEASGRPVDGLFLLDPPPPGAGAQFQSYSETQLAAVFTHELAARGVQTETTGETAKAYAALLARCCTANLRSMAAFRMPVLASTPSVVWLAGRPVDALPEPGTFARQRASWVGHLPEPSEWHELDTTHYGIVEPSCAKEIAALIDAGSPRETRA